MALPNQGLCRQTWTLGRPQCNLTITSSKPKSLKLRYCLQTGWHVCLRASLVQANNVKSMQMLMKELTQKDQIIADLEQKLAKGT